MCARSSKSVDTPQSKIENQNSKIPPILLDFPARLVGDRVVVRPYKPGDGPALNEAVIASLDHLRASMLWAQTAPTLEESEEVVRKAAARWLLREDLTMGIWDRDETRVLGGSGLYRIDWDVRKFEIGYWIRPDAEGKGFVSETVRLLCELAFDKLDAKRVFIRCSADNERSAAVARRAGFDHEGVLRNDVRNPSGVCDAMVFGMTPEMWAERGKGS